MVTCFKTISNSKLCTVHFSKITNIVKSNNTTSMKFIQSKKPKLEKSVVSKTIFANNTLRSRQLYFNDNNSLISQNTTRSSFCSNEILKNFCCDKPEISINHNHVHFSYEYYLQSKKLNPEPRPPPDNPGRPTEEQLNYIYEDLRRELPRILSFPLNHTIFRNDLIFEDNIRNKHFVGLGKYVWQLAIIRLVAHIKYAHARFIILKITKHPEDGTVKVRWRIAGIYFSEFLLKFWTFNPRNLSTKIDDAETWYDGFSIYFVGSDGLIYKHIVDKMMPDNDKITEEKTNVSPKIPKLALFLGFELDSKQLVFTSNKIEIKEKGII